MTRVGGGIPIPDDDREAIRLLAHQEFFSTAPVTITEACGYKQEVYDRVLDNIADRLIAEGYFRVPKGSERRDEESIVASVPGPFTHMTINTYADTDGNLRAEHNGIDITDEYNAWLDSQPIQHTTSFTWTEDRQEDKT